MLKLKAAVMPWLVTSLASLAVSSPRDTVADEILLRLPGIKSDDPAEIDYSKLPVLKGQHAVVCPFDEQWKFQLHNYLLHHDGKFWCMWSHGPEVEDWPTQHVRYAVSDDGLKWSESRMLSGPPEEGRAYIARDFWLRDGELLALAANYVGKGAFGAKKDLKLQAFAWNPATGEWKFRGTLYENAINNYTPQMLSTGEWMLNRRDARFNVYMLTGGVKALDDWRSVQVVDRQWYARNKKGFSPDEPVWWEQPDGKIIALMRNNGVAPRIYRSSSDDHGATWSEAEKTNYPNSSSKLFPLLTSRGYRVLISNANPSVGRRDLHLGVSKDGVTFTALARLDTPSARATTFQYPHAIERDGRLFIAYSNRKAFTELLSVALDDVDKLLEVTHYDSLPSSPKTGP